MLFSEPKIPQSQIGIVIVGLGFRFSALQRAENSSIICGGIVTVEQVGFSALQRAENSSIPDKMTAFYAADGFQCSSASRKFLNQQDDRRRAPRRRFQCSSASRKFLNMEELRFEIDRARGFSALQRAENSSIDRILDTAGR